MWRVAGNGAMTIGNSLGFDRELFMQAGAGAIQRPLEDKLRETLSARDYGATGDGVTDDTAAMLAFFNACIAGREIRATFRPAIIGSRSGQLLFDNANVRKAMAQHHHGRPRCSSHSPAPAPANSPIIEFRNGTYTGGDFDSLLDRRVVWAGSRSRLASATAGTNRHGIKAYGMYGTRFGHMIGNAPGRLHDPPDRKEVHGLRTPIPIAMAYCVFDVIEGYRNTGRTLDNRNFAGFSFCSVNAIRGIENVGGVLYGLGASNTFLYMSAGLCRGWAIHSGDQAEGQVDRGLIIYAEIDTCEYGINHRKGRQRRHSQKSVSFTATNIRRTLARTIIGRASASTSPTIRAGSADTKMDVIHRIEAGGDKADLGVFVDGNNTGNIGNVIIDQRIYPTTTGFTFADSDYYSAINVQRLCAAASRRDRDLRLDPEPGRHRLSRSAGRRRAGR